MPGTAIADIVGTGLRHSGVIYLFIPKAVNVSLTYQKCDLLSSWSSIVFVVFLLKSVVFAIVVRGLP